MLELSITPDIIGQSAFASLAQLRIAQSRIIPTAQQLRRHVFFPLRVGDAHLGR